MAKNEALKSLDSLLEKAIDDGDWDRVGRVRERLVHLLMDAAREQQVEVMEQLETTFSRSHARVILKHCVDPRPSPTAFAWMMKAEAKAASIASRFIPRSLPAAPHDMAARDKILIALASGNRCRLSNKEIAERANVSNETVARLLPRLRQEGLVSAWRAGSRMINELSASGLDEARRISAREKLNHSIDDSATTSSQMILQGSVALSQPNRPKLENCIGALFIFTGESGSAERNELELIEFDEHPKKKRVLKKQVVGEGVPVEDDPLSKVLGGTRDRRRSPRSELNRLLRSPSAKPQKSQLAVQ